MTKLTYQQLLKLDEARTPGIWDCDAMYHPGFMLPINPENTTITVMASGEGCGDVCYLNNNINQDFALNTAKFIAAAPQAIVMLKQYRELLQGIIAEAIEHWPDAENWPTIEDAQALLDGDS